MAAQQNARGRRQPDLVPTPDAPELQQLGQDQGQDQDERLLYPGAKVEAAITLAVEFGDGKTNFFKYGVEDLVQLDEDHPDAYARVATATTEGVVALIDDTQSRLADYERELERRQRVVNQQLAPGQQ